MVIEMKFWFILSNKFPFAALVWPMLPRPRRLFLRPERFWRDFQKMMAISKSRRRILKRLLLLRVKFMLHHYLIKTYNKQLYQLKMALNVLQKYMVRGLRDCVLNIIKKQPLCKCWVNLERQLKLSKRL